MMSPCFVSAELLGEFVGKTQLDGDELWAL